MLLYYNMGHGTNAKLPGSRHWEDYFNVCIDAKRLFFWHGIKLTLITKPFRSIIIDDVNEKTRGTDTALAFMYCNYKDTNTHSELALLSSIARQLTEQVDHVPPVVKEFRDQNATKKRDPTGDEWITLINSLVRSFYRTIIIVDALVRPAHYKLFLCIC